jgi:hypothetical protein
MVGVFVELQLNRTGEVVEKMHKYCDYNTRRLSANQDVNNAAFMNDVTRGLRDGILKARKAEGEIRVARAQLKKIANRIDDHETTWTTWSPPAIAANLAGTITTPISKRFKGRFKEIENDIDVMMSNSATQQRLTSLPGPRWAGKEKKVVARVLAVKPSVGGELSQSSNKATKIH